MAHFKKIPALFFCLALTGSCAGGPAAFAATDQFPLDTRALDAVLVDKSTGKTIDAGRVPLRGRAGTPEGCQHGMQGNGRGKSEEGTDRRLGLLLLHRHSQKRLHHQGQRTFLTELIQKNLSSPQRKSPSFKASRR